MQYKFGRLPVSPASLRKTLLNNASKELDVVC